MLKILSLIFFNRPTLRVAKDLLGKFLVRKIGPKTISGIITEVEAYIGPEDQASHASKGKTKRTEIMFGKPGHWYVYLIYGMHHCLNIVTERKGYPAAVLIRAVAVLPQYTNKLENVGMIFVSGPGRVCKKFEIDRTLNAKPVNKKTGLWIEDWSFKINPRLIKRGKRIGVEYAGKWAEKPWRFYVELPHDVSD